MQLLNSLFNAGWKFIYYMLTPLVFLKQRNVQKSGKLMKIFNIKGESLHIVQTN